MGENASQMEQRGILFERSLKKLKSVLNISGLRIDKDDKMNSLWKRLRYRWFFCFNMIWLNIDVVAQFAYFIIGVRTGGGLIEFTNIAPCVTLCVLGDVKMYYMIKHSHVVYELIKKLKTSVDLDTGNMTVAKKKVKLLFTSMNIMIILNSIGVLAFVVGPIIAMIDTYNATGELKFILPFLIVYPFNAYDVKFYPIAFLHEIWSAVLAVFTVMGPDFLFHVCSTFISLQFYKLKCDVEKFLTVSSRRVLLMPFEEFQPEFIELVKRQQDLIRCVELMEIIYSVSILFNFVSSSFLICFTAFNVTSFTSLVLVVPFTFFLAMVLLQIFLLCNYGHMIMESSVAIGDAVYNCRWYDAQNSLVKDLLVMLIRSQKPCKITAYGFAAVNIGSFTRILSTAWSYFALLKTVYRN